MQMNNILYEGMYYGILARLQSINVLLSNSIKTFGHKEKVQ